MATNHCIAKAPRFITPPARFAERLVYRMNQLTSFDTCWDHFIEALTARLLKIQQAEGKFSLQKANMALMGAAECWFSEHDICGGWSSALMEEAPEKCEAISDVLENKMRFTAEIVQEKGHEQTVQYGAALATGLVGLGVSSVLKANRTVRVISTAIPAVGTYLTLNNAQGAKRRKRESAVIQGYLEQLAPYRDEIRGLL